MHTTEDASIGDSDTDQDVYQLDNGAATLVSEGVDANLLATFRGATPDGERAAFTTSQQLAGDGDSAVDVFDFSDGNVEWVSRPNVIMIDNVPASFQGYINANGEVRVQFTTSQKAVPTDTDSHVDVFSRRINAGDTTVKLSAGNGAFNVTYGAVSFDGTRAAYATNEQLRAQDPDAEADAQKTIGATTTLESYELVPPETTITGGPSGLTTDNTPNFRIAANEANVTFQCSFDGGSFGACTTAPTLDDGPHTFTARTIDRPGNVDPTPANRAFTVDTKGPKVGIARNPRRANRRGRFKVTLTCPRAEHGGCTGTLTLRSAKKVKIGNRRKFVAFGKTGFTLESGESKPVTIKLSRKNRALLRRLRSVRLRARASASDGLGNSAASVRRITLKRPK